MLYQFCFLGIQAVEDGNEISAGLVLAESSGDYIPTDEYYEDDELVNEADDQLAVESEESPTVFRIKDDFEDMEPVDRYFRNRTCERTPHGLQIDVTLFKILVVLLIILTTGFSIVSCLLYLILKRSGTPRYSNESINFIKKKPCDNFYENV